MNRVQGDLIQLALNGTFDVIVHGCNCFHTMGAGIAKSIKHYFPEAHAADLGTAYGDRAKLGTYSCAVVKRNGHAIAVVNAYTQFRYGNDKPHLDYEAVSAVFKRINLNFPGAHIGYPKIGAGLGGGNWEHVHSIIRNELTCVSHTLVEFAGKPSPRPGETLRPSAS